MQHTTCTLIASILACLALPAPVRSFERPGAITHIQVSFKLDPRLASGVYGGENWVSPQVYTGMNAQDTIEIKASGLDTAGNVVAILPQWIASDPEMVTVTPSQGDRVKITVQRAGAATLRVVSGPITKELAIKAVAHNGSLRVEIAQSEAKPNESAALTPNIANAPNSQSLLTHKARLSYALGANLANGLQRENVEVDADMVIQGLKDVLAGTDPLLSQHEISVAISGLKSELTSKRIVSAAQRINAKRELAEQNKKDGEAFLIANKAREGVVTLESGLQYRILKAGNGKQPAPHDTVVAHYRGTLIDGTEFDSSYKGNQPATFPMDRVIKGWNEALQLMRAGSKWQIFVPSQLAYGERGMGSSIGPNAVLIFEVELISVADKSAESASQATSVRAQRGRLASHR